MKIRDQAADHAELKPWIDEQIGRPAARDDAAATLTRNGFERARRRRADGNHAPSFVERGVDCVCRRSVDCVSLGLDAVIFDAIDADRLERTVTDMQGNL